MSDLQKDLDLLIKFDSTMERIICAANWYQSFPRTNAMPVNINYGMVLCGMRHCHIIANLFALTEIRTAGYDVIQGFMTSKNRFVDRVEGLAIATAANQIVKKHGCPTELFSEDLY